MDKQQNRGGQRSLDEHAKEDFLNISEQIHPSVAAFFRSIPEDLLPPSDSTTPRARILEAASVMFGDKGYAGTSTRAIAESAGVNQAMINYYFGKKENLFTQVVTGKLYMLFRSIAATIDPTLTPSEFVITLPVRIINEFRNKPDLLRIVRRELALGGGMMKQVIESLGPHGPIGFIRLLNVRYQEGVEAGELHDYPFDALVQYIISLSYSFLLMEPLISAVQGSSVLDEDVWINRKPHIEEIIRHGLAARKES